MNDLKKTVLSALPDIKLLENVPYKEITTIGVGSTLPFLADVSSAEQLKKLLKALDGSGFPFFILGAGSNLIGMDAPYPGLGIRLESRSFSDVEFSGVFMRCGAALRLSRAARFAADEGLGALSELSGIPGTLGGAVRMNAGASMIIQAALLLITGPQFEDERYPYPALKKNKATKTMTAITAMHVIII